MLEHHVDALLGGDPPDCALEAVGAVVDHVVGAERSGLRRLGVVADGGDDGRADRLRHLDRNRADAGAAGMHEHGLAGLKPGVVEQHVLHGRERDRRAGRVAKSDSRRDRDHQPGRQVEEIAGEAVDVEAHDPADVLAQIVAAVHGARPSHPSAGPRCPRYR